MFEQYSTIKIYVLEDELVNINKQIPPSEFYFKRPDIKSGLYIEVTIPLGLFEQWQNEINQTNKRHLLLD